MRRRKASFLKAALLMPANLFALMAGGAASLAFADWVPLAAAVGASVSYLALLSVMPSFRRMVQAQAAGLYEEASTREALLADLSHSQRQHYEELAVLKTRILESYRKMPGGRVLAASSEGRLEGLLESFVRLLGTLNSHRRFLGAVDREAIEHELAELEGDLPRETSQRLREVKARRVDILKKRVERFQQAEESREVVSHQLASIEDLLRLTHEQSIAIRDPEVMSRQLEALTAEAEATEEMVKNMEQAMQVTEELNSISAPHAQERIR